MGCALVYAGETFEMPDDMKDVLRAISHAIDEGHRWLEVETPEGRVALLIGPSTAVRVLARNE